MKRSTEHNQTGRPRTAVYSYRKRRKDGKIVRDLLAFLRDRHVLRNPLYQEHPEATLESVERIRTRLRNDLERLTNGSKALWPLREMHEACLGFLNRIEPLTRYEPLPKLGETELLSDKWAGGVYRQTLGDALTRMKGIVDSRMDELYEAYGIEKPPSTLYAAPLPRSEEPANKLKVDDKE